jgi:hypothetical protein
MVTYDGKPVPGGRILFTPDRGNPGPASVAEITDGKYRTRSEKGVIGADQVDIAPDNSTMDFDVPRTGAARKK